MTKDYRVTGIKTRTLVDALRVGNVYQLLYTHVQVEKSNEP